MLMSVNVQGGKHRGMETRWYIPSGKSMSETKINERKLALHTTKEAWKKITGHLDRKRLQAEAIQKEIDQKNRMKETSDAMTKNWDNSVENIRKRKEEERIRKIEQSKEDKIQRFLLLRKEQEEIRQKYMKDKRKELYVMQGPPKALNSALLLSEVIYEREKQIEMKDFLNQHKIEMENEYAKKVKQGALDEERENREKFEKERQKKIEIGKFYLDKIDENKKLRESEKQRKIKLELEDILAAGREAEQMKNIEIQEEVKRRQDAKKEFDEFYARQKKYKMQIEKEDLEQDQVVDIYATAKCIIEETRKRKEAEALREKNLRAAKLASKVAAVVASKQGEEERILREAQEEKERAELERIAERAEYDKQLLRERLENREHVVKLNEKRKYEENEMKKWIMLNRYKGDETIKIKEEEKRKKHLEKVMKYRNELLQQMEEKKQVEKLDKEYSKLELEHIKNGFKNMDETFLEYAKEVTDLATNRGRTLYPIKRVVLEYKRENNLLPSHKERICAMKNEMNKELINCTPGKMTHDPKTDPNMKHQQREAFKQFIYN